jgi:cytochrome c-type biogenesis protein CcmH
VIGFLLIAALMLLGALAFVLIPLLRSATRASAPLTEDASNVAVFRAQKREIESDFAQSLISAEERDHALAELRARLAAEVSAESGELSAQTASRDTGRATITAVLVAVAFPISAVLVYAALGSPQILSGGASMQARAGSATTPGTAPNSANGGAQPSGEPPMSDKQIVAMVDALAQKMDANPTDPKGWILLARSQNALGRHNEAEKAYERAVALQPGDAQLFADYADAAVMAQSGRFDGKPYRLINQALKLDPVNLKALALAGTAEMRLGNKDASLKHWEKIKSLVAKDSEDYREVEAIIAEVKTGTPPPRSNPGAPVAPPPVAPPPAAPSSAAAASPTPSAASGDAAKPAASQGARVTGAIALAPELANKLAAGDTLFVIARAVNGPNMPLAVMRIPAPKSWPHNYELNDGMAMAPGMNLSAFPQVTVEARISKSGGAKAQPGDLSGQSAPIKPGATGVAITISRVLP